LARLGTAYVLASAAQTTTFNSGNLVLDEQTNALLFAMNISAISGAGAQAIVTIDGIGPDSVAYNLYTSAALTAVAKTIAYIGPALSTNVQLWPVIKVTVTISGTTPSITMSAEIEQESS